MPASRASAIQALQRRQVADADIGVDVDLRRDRGLGAQVRRASDGVVAGVSPAGDARRQPLVAGARAAGWRHPPMPVRPEPQRDRRRPTSGPCASAALSTLTGAALDRGQVGAGRLGDAAGQRGEFHRLEEGDQLRPVRRLQREIVEPVGDRHVVLQRHQLARNARLVGIGDDRLAALVLLDLGGARQQRVEIAEMFRAAAPPSSGRCPECQARCRPKSPVIACRSIIFSGGTPHFSMTSGMPIWRSFIGSYIDTVCADELHQILVGRDDGRVAARLAGQPRIGGDQVVGLEAFHLDAGQVEGARRLADQAELRDRGLPAAPSGWPCIRDRARCGRSSTNSRRSPRNASA